MPILGYFLVIGASLVDIFKLFPRVEERLEQAARLLSGGEQQYMGPATATLWNNLASSQICTR
jgi:ABC-type branched-subunit amino acid transport system ATPase component